MMTSATNKEDASEDIRVSNELRTHPNTGPSLVSGFVAPGYEMVEDVFAANFTSRGDVGAAFAAYVDGEPVVDLWGGAADPSSARPWASDTLQLIFSGTKGLVAAAINMLADRGEVRLENSLATYWPEFAAAGKKDITVLDVLSHQAGLPTISAKLSQESILDPLRMAALLADQAPSWAGEGRLSYHALTYGWLCGELVRRVTGATIGQFVRAEIAVPLGADIWIGLPPELEPRVSTLCLGADFSATFEPTDTRYSNPPIFNEPLPWNRPAFHQAEIAGANAIGEARGIAAFYGCLASGGTLGGTRLISAESVTCATVERVRGFDPVGGDSLSYGAGFALQTESASMGPAASAFGHRGAGGSVHGAWPRHRVGFSYTMNELRDGTDDDRSRGLLAALYAAVCRR